MANVLHTAAAHRTTAGIRTLYRNGSLIPNNGVMSAPGRFVGARAVPLQVVRPHADCVAAAQMRQHSAGH
jgi:hypothetical protein